MPQKIGYPMMERFIIGAKLLIQFNRIFTTINYYLKLLGKMMKPSSLESILLLKEK
jgi:hypothetical protein